MFCYLLHLGFDEAAELLIEKGADVNVVNDRGKSALKLLKNISIKYRQYVCINVFYFSSR